MILSIKSHLSEFIAKGIISNVNKREVENSEGVGIDLSARAVYLIGDEIAFLGKEFRKTPSSKELRPSKDGVFELQSGMSYLVETVEVFNLPEEISCQFFPRSTLFRSGVIFQSSILSHGYVGPMLFNLTNFGKKPFFLEKHARFSTAVFYSVKGSSNPYAGQWNGGRVSQNKSERQI
ncbi:dCTP deaminase domain-containing protein [Pantoea leporis]|jgi:deoxycytidine triphosphate deaminase|uniref:dCTP deaminase domain-containing protein n=1 Tax=Pantoea leporis TaxID=2933780 RepID=UPI0023043971|nr:hypothetical protein [Pantoea leporis]